MNATERTEKVVKKWFDSLRKGDYDTAVSCLDENIEWINMHPIKGVSDVMPWIGTQHGIAEVKEALGKYHGEAEVKVNEPVDFIVQGNQAAGKIHEIATIKSTGKDFEINFCTWLTVDPDKGKIIRWKSYTDPSPILAAYGKQYK